MSSLGLDVVKIRLVKERSTAAYRAVSTPEDAVELIKKELSTYDSEVVCLVNVRSDFTPINMNIVSIGTINSSLCSPRDVFKSSILSNAAGFILFHNHPSGRCEPSADDYKITKRLSEAGKILDIELLDHIIVSSGPMPGYFSFKEHGILEAGGFDMAVREKDHYER